jgi:hypothetical protein
VFVRFGAPSKDAGSLAALFTPSLTTRFAATTAQLVCLQVSVYWIEVTPQT